MGRPSKRKRPASDQELESHVKLLCGYIDDELTRHCEEGHNYRRATAAILACAQMVKELNRYRRQLEGLPPLELPYE
jgi:hypothetical protein